ncbi:MAG: DMT family transporter [Pseudomonadota bacterium]|nr:DMT family transporter [Pseudomonadota bacterium]
MTKHSGTMRFQQNISRGILFMCLAILLMPVMNTIAKILTVDYPLTQVVWARFTGHFVCMTLLFWPGRGLKLFRSGRPVLQLLRSVIMFLSNGCYIVALSTVALATASAIMFTAPLIVTALSVPLLGERVGLRRWAAVVVGFIGALIIIRPGLNTPAFDGTALGIVLLLFSAATFALYQILTRKLSDQDSAETNIVYTALIAAIVTTCIMPFVLVMPKGVGDGLLFALVGVVGGFSQYFIAKALEQAPASVVSPYLYGELLLAAMVGFAVFGDFPDHWTWLGAAAIAASGLYIAYREGVIGEIKP